jgi:hypothetical protein
VFWQLGTPVTIVQSIAKLRERNRKSEVMGPPPGNISYVSIQHAQHTHPRLKSRYRDIQHHLDRVDQNQSVFRLQRKQVNSCTSIIRTFLLPSPPLQLLQIFQPNLSTCTVFTLAVEIAIRFQSPKRKLQQSESTKHERPLTKERDKVERNNRKRKKATDFQEVF